MSRSGILVNKASCMFSPESDTPLPVDPALLDRGVTSKEEQKNLFCITPKRGGGTHIPFEHREVSGVLTLRPEFALRVT